MKIQHAAVLAVLAALASPLWSKPASGEIVIPYTKFVLDNGLTLLVHEDPKTPIVAVNVWYHVGSKNEKQGKTGFAHLFEHLMFNGSEHFNDDYFKAMEKVGATDLNGTTSEDRTNYFQNVPKDALDYALWMESDRMGHMLGAITQERLDEQRGVVQNEKRQYENQPYSIAYRLITGSVWPAGHPYSWPVIGSMEDLNAASLDDVREWFKTYYGAANATVVVAGDVTAQEAFEKVKKAFGSVPPGPPVARHSAWVAKRSGTQRQRVEDRVPLARLYKVWNTPGYGTREGNLLRLVGDALSDGKSSRLYKRLVYDDRIATDVHAFADLGEIAGTFNIVATAAAGADLAAIEKAVDEELCRFLKSGPTSAELERVKTQAEAAYVRGVERIGGFGGKSDLLAQNQVYLGNPDYHVTQMREIRGATSTQLRAAARDWLSDGQYVLELRPFAPYAAAPADVDRSAPPLAQIKPETRFPELRRAVLSNGLKIVLAERPSIPVVQLALLVDAGYAADSLASPGTARLTVDMLSEGTASRTSLEISDAFQRLGAQFSAGCSLDTCSVSLNALKKNLDASLDLYADIILNPAFPPADFKRLQEHQLAGIRQEKADPKAVAFRVLPRVLFGDRHAYGNPLSGSGYEASVASLSVPDMSRFHSMWFRPNNATLVIAGDVTLAEVTPLLERLFRDWKPGDVPKKKTGLTGLSQKPTVTVVDRPGSIQSVVLVGTVAPPKAADAEQAIELMNKLLGGDFTSRINMNLREDKHWTYGARSTLLPAQGPRPFWVAAPVQGDKTKETMRELDRELRDILGARPVTAAEYARVLKNQTLRLPGSWETIASVAGAVTEIVCFGLPDDYFQSMSARLNGVTLEQVQAAAENVVRVGGLSWVVVGDRAKIEAGIRELGFGEVRFVDADGEPVTP